jgi:hypothetical protein
MFVRFDMFPLEKLEEGTVKSVGNVQDFIFSKKFR